MDIKLDNITKSFGIKKVFNGYNLTVCSGEFVALTGESGKGKSTLLNIIGLLEKPDSGSVKISNYINPTLFQSQQLRRDTIGYLFQGYALVDNKTVWENLKLALVYSHMSKSAKKDFAIEKLSEVSLDSSYMEQYIYELSGGEQQRVAIARLLLKPFQILLADEPTGSLDDDNKKTILKLLQKMNSIGKTIIIATHDKEVTDICHRIERLL